MNIQELIDVLNHTKKELGKEAEVIFSYGVCDDRREFDYGEKGRPNGNVCVTIYETWAHVDGWGRFHIPLRRVPIPDVTPELVKAEEEAYRKMNFSEETIAKIMAKQRIREAAIRKKDKREIAKDTPDYRKK